MADGTKIEWSDSTWNVITGCSVVSPGCTNCYAMRLAGTRMKHHKSREGLTMPTKAGPVWNGEVRFNGDWLDQPLQWTRPRMVFVCAHGDLFHPGVPFEWIDYVFDVMARAPQHTFQVLTKRPDRMKQYIEGLGHRYEPPPNVWLGTSAEDQTRWDERVEPLYQLALYGWITWVSAEPLLGPIDMTLLRRHPDRTKGTDWDRGIQWVVVGGESGPGARPMHPDWVRHIAGQCQAAAVPFFFKQWGDWFVFNKDYSGIIRSHGAISVHPPADGAIDYTEEHPRYVNVYHHDRVRELPNGDVAVRMGKKLTGRLLDGLEYSDYPTPIEQ